VSSQVAVAKYPASEALPEALWVRMKTITDEIRERAFGLFELRCGTHGSDIDDWLHAEREMVFAPRAELLESKDLFRVRVAMPGFDAADVEVCATPESLIIQAEAAHAHDGEEGDVHFCEFSGKKLFRRVDLPARINSGRVTASLEKGILQVNAPKDEQKLVSAAV
jgi:HSP20 family molecular chaperone IbpA